MKQMMNILFVMLVATIIPDKIQAQVHDSTKFLNGLSLSYIKNGLQLGAEKYYLQSHKYKVIGSLNLRYQRFPSYYSSLGLIYNYSLRRTGKSGIYTEQGLQVGYLGSYYDFDKYKVKSDGSLVNMGRTWTSSVFLGFFIGLGYDFSQKTKIDLQLYAKPGLYYRFPNNDNLFYLTNFSLEIGLIFHPKWLK